MLSRAGVTRTKGKPRASIVRVKDSVKFVCVKFFKMILEGLNCFTFSCSIGQRVPKPTRSHKEGFLVSSGLRLWCPVG